LIEDVRTKHGTSIAGVLQNPAIRSRLIGAVDQVVRVMPLWKLQTVGRQQLDFLYPNAGTGITITLRSGVVFCFRQFYELVADLVRGAWLRNVRQQNLEILGEATDLSEFLFGSERSSLAAVREVLQDIQGGRCFYCGAGLNLLSTEVDHFIAWSRYPADLGHNFVLADRSCNNRKKDRLPAYENLCSWVERNEKYGRELTSEFRQRDIVQDLGASARIAHWAYPRPRPPRD
jgi:5-methylcytosine-specific restriction endonuclease McrA